MSDTPPPNEAWFQAEDGKWYPKPATSTSRGVRVALVGLGALVLILGVAVVALVLQRDAGVEVETTDATASTTSATTEQRSTTTASPVTTTTVEVFDPGPEPEGDPLPTGPSQEVIDWAAAYSGFIAQLASLNASDPEQALEACVQQREAIRTTGPTLLPAPDPVLSGDFSEYLTAAEQVATICIEYPWIFETDHSSVDRRNAAHSRIVDQIYLLGGQLHRPVVTANALNGSDGTGATISIRK